MVHIVECVLTVGTATLQSDPLSRGFLRYMIENTMVYEVRNPKLYTFGTVLKVNTSYKRMKQTACVLI